MLRILIKLCETHLGSYIGLSLAMILYRMLLNLFVIWGQKTIGLGVAQIYKMRTYKVTADCFLNLKDFFRLLLWHVQFGGVAEGGEGEVPVDPSSPPPPVSFFSKSIVYTYDDDPMIKFAYTYWKNVWKTHMNLFQRWIVIWQSLVWSGECRKSTMFSDVIVFITFPYRALMFTQSCCEVSASLTDVEGLAIGAIDLINRSLSKNN